MTQRASNKTARLRNTSGIILLGSMVAMTLLLTQPQEAVAAEGDAIDEAIEEVIVTARRREERLSEVPMAITALTAESMELSGIQTIMDVGREVPNLNITRFGVGNTSHAAISIRGLGVQDHIITTDPSVGIYVDGIYLGRQMGANLNLRNIERVEVLRGPQGTLYGRNTIGGAVNIITQKPGEIPGTSFQLEAGTRARVSANFFSSFNMGDDVGMSVGAGFTRRNGVGEALLVVDEAKDVGEIFEASMRVAVDWQATPNWNLLFTFDGVQGDGGQSGSTAELFPASNCAPAVPANACFFADPANISFLPPPNNEPLTPDDIAADPYDTNTGEADLLSQNNSGFGISFTADRRINDNLDFKFLSGYRQMDYKGGLDDETAFQDFQSFPEDGEADQLSLEAQLTGLYGGFDFVTGLYYFTEEGNTFSGITTFITPGDFFDVNQETTSIAGYFHGGFQVTDPLRITAGVRYTSDDKDADALFTNFPWFLPPPDGNGDGTPGSAQREFRSDDWSEFTWDLTATYGFNPDLNFYFTTSKGYQNGGYPARPFGGPGQFVAFAPQTAQNYEIGIKGRPFRNWQLAANVFYTEFEDQQLDFSQPTAAGFVTTTLNAGESETKGVELESTLRTDGGFSFLTNIGYIDAEITQVDPGTIGIAEGDTPKLTPELTAFAAAQYDMNVQNINNLTFRLDYSYRDFMFGQSVNNQFNRIESRELVNLLVRYEHTEGDWALSLYGDNVFDEEYAIGRLDQGFGGFTEIILSNDRSEFGIRYTKNFGGE